MNIKASLAGFNTSKRADRSSVKAFIASYIKVFPDRERALWEKVPDLYDWMEVMLGKSQPPERVVKDSFKPRKEWVPPALYIPDNPHPKKSYRSQAANIARAMRQQIDKEVT